MPEILVLAAGFRVQGSRVKALHQVFFEEAAKDFPWLFFASQMTFLRHLHLSLIASYTHESLSPRV